MGDETEQNNNSGTRQNLPQTGGFNSSISRAKNAAQSFLTDVKAIETELMVEVETLNLTITQRDTTINSLQQEISSLKNELANQPDCNEVSAADERRTDDDLTNPYNSKSRKTNKDHIATID